MESSNNIDKQSFQEDCCQSNDENKEKIDIYSLSRSQEKKSDTKITLSSLLNVGFSSISQHDNKCYSDSAGNRYVNNVSQNEPISSRPNKYLQELLSNAASNSQVRLHKRKVQNPVGSVKITIAGTSVIFPHEAYPVQKYMMNQVLKAVNTAKNCLLESPTGTGKTLALLCSTLAWQDQESELISKLRQTAPGGASNAYMSDHVAGTYSSKENTLVDGKKLEIAKTPVKLDTSSSSKENTFDDAKKIEKAVTPFEAEADSDSDDIFRSPKLKKNKQSIHESASRVDSNKTTQKILKEVEVREDKAVEEKLISTETMRIPKIYYGTRTHKQIGQVVEQLKKTGYANSVKMTILAARDHTCVNNLVRFSGCNVTEQCQALIDPIKGAGCSYYNSTCMGTSHKNLNSYGLAPVFDIEDIVRVGKRYKTCPYFTLRNLVVQSEIIFCPYNYLIDPIIRESMNINLNRSVVIMDEAHNIEDCCREVGSLLLKQSELEEAIAECENNIRNNDNSQQYALIKEFLNILLNFLAGYAPTINYTVENESQSIMPGRVFMDWLEGEGMNLNKFQEFKMNMSIINQNRADDPEQNQSMSTKVKQTASGIKVVLNYLYMSDSVDKYQAYIIREIKQRKSEQPSASSWLTKHRSTSTTDERVWYYNLHLMCLSPEVVFSELLNARSIILASGTLSPLETFQSELGVEFPNVVRGWHVVPNENIFVSAIRCGPYKVDLKGVFENANRYEYQDELGRCILETIKRVPHGVLCFVPSYTLMQKLRDRWSACGLLDEMEKVKELFWEPRGKDDLNQIMKDFTERIELSVKNPEEEIGAAMFGVFRGKIAEGIDFSDDMARAVISVGIPFMNMHSKEINLKMKYNNSNTQKKLLSGYEWYRVQAYRALNQALGRCIRHSRDWGAVILMDSRLCQSEMQGNLPRWINSQMRPFQGWETYLTNLTQFCDLMKNKPTEQTDRSATPGPSCTEQQ